MNCTYLSLPLIPASGTQLLICTTGQKFKAHTVHCVTMIMGPKASQITSLTINYSTVYSGADQRKLPRSVPLVFPRGIHRCLVNSPHKGPVTRKIIPFDDVAWWYTYLAALSLKALRIQFAAPGIYISINTIKCYHSFALWDQHLKYPNTVDCCHNAVQYCKILHKYL